MVLENPFNNESGLLSRARFHSESGNLGKLDKRIDRLNSKIDSLILDAHSHRMKTMIFIAVRVLRDRHIVIACMFVDIREMAIWHL